jgi:hypothetical protein
VEPRHRLAVLAALAAALLLGGSAADARVLLTQKDALALAFPAGGQERRTAFLTPEQTAAAEKAARSKLDSAVWTYYVSGSTTAYFESHPVRTMNETVMVVLRGREVAFVEVLSFSEPEDFLAPKRWLGQFKGRVLDDELALRRGLRGITGATLTSEAVARSVRRVLAVDEVLHSRP